MSADLKIKTAAGKPVMALLPMQALVGAARIAEYGAQKYERGNWHKGQDAGAPERYVSAALRHLVNCQNPNGVFDWTTVAAVDAESGGYDLDHIILGLLYLRGMAIATGAMKADPGRLEYAPPTPKDA